MGFRLQGLDPHRGGRIPLENRLLSCAFAAAHDDREAEVDGSARFRALLSPESPFRREPKLAERDDALLTFRSPRPERRTFERRTGVGEAGFG
jgi:hypothetical protein